MSFSGIRQVKLETKNDNRGSLTEIYKESWAPEVPARQVNVMASKAGSVRGCHVHREHVDYFYIVQGKSSVGLCDVRRKSPTFGQSSVVYMGTAEPFALIIPPGIVHIMFFPVNSILVTVESLYFDPDEDVEIDWTDIRMNGNWPFVDSIAYEKEMGVGFEVLMDKIEPWQKGFKI